MLGPPESTNSAQFDSIEDVYRVLGPVMAGIAAVVGSHCEVVLHDLSSDDMNHSIYAIENGQVSGRTVGGPSTNLGLEVLSDQTANHDACGYRSRTADGRELRSSSIYYRDRNGRVIAALCINLDLTPFQSAESALRAIMPVPADPEGQKELVGPSIDSILSDMIDDAIAAVGKAAPLMDKPDRIEVLRLLEAQGAFHIKRAVEQVSRRLGISRVTAYGYLEQLRR